MLATAGLRPCAVIQSMPLMSCDVVPYPWQFRTFTDINGMPGAALTTLRALSSAASVPATFGVT